MGNQAGIIIRNVKNELFHSAKRLILNEVKGIECLHLVDLIIKSMRVARSKINIGVSKKSINWVDELEGKWIDSRSADEMISDIRTARTNNSEVIL